MLSYIDNFIIFKNIKMKTFKFCSLLLSFVLCFNSSYACDLLDIEIGENWGEALSPEIDYENNPELPSP